MLALQDTGTAHQSSGYYRFWHMWFGALFLVVVQGAVEGIHGGPKVGDR